MRIAVLSSPDSWYFRDLVRAAGHVHHVHAISHSRLSVGILGPAIRFPSNQHPWNSPSIDPQVSDDVQLTDYDAILVRSMPPGSLEQVVFRMNVLARVCLRRVAVFNPPRSLEMAIDKFLTSALIQEAGLLQPETCTSQTADQAMADYEALGGDVVIKPLFGGEGRGLMRVTDPDLAFRAFRTLEQLSAVIYLQRFVPHRGYDLRLFVLGQQIWGMKRINDDDWRTNVSRGARTEPLEVTAELAEIAIRGANAVGAPIAGVDVLPGQDGRLYLLEVNAVPGWRALSRTLGLDVAARVLAFLEERVRGQT